MDDTTQNATPRTRSRAPGLPVVLIVDDIADNLLALEGVLRRDDVEIVSARSGQDALEALLEHDVAVAIIDVMMPEMDGFELAELIRGVDRTRHVPIIFVTAGSRAEYRVFTGYQTGAIDFLFKPLDEQILRAKVDVLVKLEKQRRQLDLAVAAERRAHERVAQLQRVTAALNGVVSPETIGRCCLPLMCETIGACMGALTMLSTDGKELETIGSVGIPQEILQSFRRMSVDANVSAAEAIRTHEPVFIESGDEYERKYGGLVGRLPGYLPGTRVTIPLVVNDRVIGTMGFGFSSWRAVPPADRAFLLTTAGQCAQALERARLYERERRARQDAEDAHQELRLAQEKLRVALSAGRMGVWEWSIPTGRVAWSPTLEMIHGLELGAFPGTFEAYQSDIHPEDREQLLRTVQETLETGCDHHVEYRIVLPDGRVRWVAGHGNIVSRAEGKPVTMMGVCADITEQKRATAELEQTLRDNEIFAGVLGHDLRTPLGAIVTAAQLVLHRSEGDDDIVRLATRIVSSGTRMSRMIQQLLDFTRARVGGGIDVRAREADLASICDQVVGELGLSSPAWKMKVERLGDLRGTWDPDRLLQVVSNLLANAGQHGSSAAPILINLDGTAQDSVVLEVRNAGTIPESLLPTLFAPFRGTRDRKSEGLGLGLFITRDIVAGHGGRIEVASSDAAGTSFKVRLPRQVGSRPR